MLNSIMQWLNPKARRAESAKADLKANAEKALRMKQEAGPQTNIPEHQTAHEGLRPKPAHEDHKPSREGDFTPELTRSNVARSGDH
jgi:hypothetical protein